MANNKKDKKSQSLFTRFAKKTASISGKPVTFLGAVLVIAVWGLSGPVFGYSDTWQLVINTGTTIITFLMVFLIQNTQNRDTLAIQLKLDELICAVQKANNEMLDLEDDDESELEEKHQRMVKLAEKAKSSKNTDS
ncbi:MAG: low affinity iron permease family protein [Pyrinomonadaceae bacterium]